MVLISAYSIFRRDRSNWLNCIISWCRIIISFYDIIQWFMTWAYYPGSVVGKNVNWKATISSLRVPSTLGLARSKSSFWFHAIEYTRTSSYIPENRSNSVLSGRQRPLNVGKIAFRRSQFRPIRQHEVENFCISNCSWMFSLQDTYLQNLLSVRLWPLEALFLRFFDFLDPKITGMSHLGHVAGDIGLFNI